MSHYAVAVFSNDGDFDRLLAPYDENNQSQFVFVPVDYQKIVDDFNQFQRENRDWTLDMYIKDFGYIFEDYMWGYRHNPHGYWDWYSLDGKDYMFAPKRGAELAEDQYHYRKNDIDWYPDDHESETEASDFWDSFVGENAFASPPGIWNRQYYLDRYKTKEQYVKEWSRAIPYAFVTPDGVWHSAGRVGWFATSDETAESADRYAEEWDAWIASDENPYVSLVDCHI